MILIFGALTDPGIASICTRLLDRNADLLVLDTRLYPQQFDLTWSFEQGAIAGSIDCRARRVPLSEVRSAWVRWLGLPERLGDAAPNGEEPCSAPREAYCSLVAFLESLPALVVNRPLAGSSNDSKPYQQQLIARYGFRVPRTLVTTVPEEALRFYRECHGRVIYKSVSGIRSIVTRMTPADLERLEQIRGCPTQFQEYVPGVEIRVHTIGRRVFASEIITEATDYRFASQQGASGEIRAVDLPTEIEERCLELAQGLRLMMSGIDLRRSPEGEYYCLEANPRPGFEYYEMLTGQSMGEALVDLLCQGAA